MICTYKFYTKDNQRIAAFCRELDSFGNREVLLLFCSQKDNFSKKVAKQFYQDWLFNRLLVGPGDGSFISTDGRIWHPETLTVRIESDLRAWFLDYMESNYYRKGTSRQRYTQPILYKAGKTDDGKKLYVKKETVIYVGKAYYEATKMDNI